MNLDDAYDLTNDPYVDPASGILKNLLGIIDDAQLRAVEQDVTYAAIAQVLADQPQHLTDIDFDSLVTLHQHIFGTIYPWAGTLRTIEMSKGNTRFAFSQYIDELGRSIFANLAAEHYLADLDHDAFVARLAYYYSELNILHPFREGNGRTIRTLLSIVAYQTRGVIIAWDDMSAMENVEASAYAYAHDESKLVAMLYRLVD